MVITKLVLPHVPLVFPLVKTVPVPLYVPLVLTPLNPLLIVLVLHVEMVFSGLPLVPPVNINVVPAQMPPLVPPVLIPQEIYP